MSPGNGRKIATIDIGSNSIVLLIAQCFPDGTVDFLEEHYALTKLGKDVKTRRMLSDDAIDHTIAAVNELKKLALEDGADDIMITASSAVRMAENRNRFLVKCYKELGLFPQVLSGREEAEYTYLGATSDVSTEKPIVTIDVGGGSTEISWGSVGKMVEGHSIDVGCVSLKEEFDLGVSYSLYKRLAAIHYLKKEFAVIAPGLNSYLNGEKPTLIATGGTITTYAGIQLEKEVYDRKRINMIKGKRKELALILRKLARMDIKSRKRVPGMILDRVEEMPAGLLIISEFLKYFQFKRFFISSNGLRAGILKHYAERL